MADPFDYTESGLEPTRGAQCSRIEDVDVKCSTWWHGTGGKIRVAATLYGLGGSGNEALMICKIGPYVNSLWDEACMLGVATSVHSVTTADSAIAKRFHMN